MRALCRAGLVAVVVACWRHVARHLRHAASSLGIGVGLSAAVLAYPTWFGLAGPQAVSGVLFPFAPMAGELLWQFFSTAGARLPAYSVVRSDGYLGHNGPQSNFMGWGEGALLALSVIAARRRPLAWLWIFLALVGAALSLGSIFLGPPTTLAHIWLPWRELAKLPVLDEILPDQLSWFVTLSVAVLLALGLDAGYAWFTRSFTVKRRTLRVGRSLLAVGVGLVALVPVFMTYDVPLTVTSAALPRWMAHDAPKLPNRTVLLTVPFAVSGSADPMLWQAVDGMHFRLAGAALKTPDAHGHPVAQGSKDSARRILAALSGGSARAGRDPRPVGHRAHGVAHLAGRSGRRRRTQPGPGLRVGISHRGAGNASPCRPGRVGVEGAISGRDGADGHRCLPQRLPRCLRGLLCPAPSAGHGALRSGGWDVGTLAHRSDRRLRATAGSPPYRTRHNWVLPLRAACRNPCRRRRAAPWSRSDGWPGRCGPAGSRTNCSR